jgi:hypothetical protein
VSRIEEPWTVDVELEVVLPLATVELEVAVVFDKVLVMEELEVEEEVVEVGWKLVVVLEELDDVEDVDDVDEVLEVDVDVVVVVMCEGAKTPATSATRAATTMTPMIAITTPILPMAGLSLGLKR